MRKILILAVFAAMAMLSTPSLGGVTAAYGHEITESAPSSSGPESFVPAVRGSPDVGDGPDEGNGHEVSRAQYRVLISQCQYANSASARAQCRSDVASTYRIGRADPTLDCRTFSSVTVCGEVQLGKKELACVKESVNGGLTYRRAEVECYAFQ